MIAKVVRPQVEGPVEFMHNRLSKDKVYSKPMHPKDKDGDSATHRSQRYS